MSNTTLRTTTTTKILELPPFETELKTKQVWKKLYSVTENVEDCFDYCMRQTTDGEYYGYIFREDNGGSIYCLHLKTGCLRKLAACPRFSYSQPDWDTLFYNNGRLFIITDLGDKVMDRCAVSIFDIDNMRDSSTALSNCLKLFLRLNV